MKKALFVAFLLPISAFTTSAAEGIKSTSEMGVFSFNEPRVAINYIRDPGSNEQFALAIGVPELSVSAPNGLKQTTAMIINCKTGRYAVTLGWKIDRKDQKPWARKIGGIFCWFHQKNFKHSLW
jgi:hypothetical protein